MLKVQLNHRNFSTRFVDMIIYKSTYNRRFFAYCPNYNDVN